MTEIMLPVGRLVGGHPMKKRPVVDDRTNPPTPKMQADGITPQTNTFIAIAIAKGPEQHWNQTVWGAAIWNEGVAGWPGGEYQAATFAWKVEDGDSAIPNKKGKKNRDREGYPGHWIVKCTTQWEVKCYHKDRYAPTQQIQNENEIKPGDYCMVLLDVKGNAPSQSPGVYVNPQLFSLERAGIAIQLSDGPDAQSAFSGVQRELPPGALVDNNVKTPQINQLPPQVPPQVPPMQQAPPQVPPMQQAPPQVPPANVAPATDFLNNAQPQTPPAVGAAPPPPPPQVESYNVQGVVYTRAILERSGYTAEMIAALPRA